MPSFTRIFRASATSSSKQVYCESDVDASEGRPYFCIAPPPPSPLRAPTRPWMQGEVYVPASLAQVARPDDVPVYNSLSTVPLPKVIPLVMARRTPRIVYHSVSHL